MLVILFFLAGTELKMHKKRTSIDPVRFQYTLAYSNYRGLIPAAVRHAERTALAAVDPGMCGDVA